MTPITPEQMRRDYMTSANYLAIADAKRLAVMFADEAGIPLTDFLGGSRNHDIARFRQDCMRMLRDWTDLTLTQIGHIFSRDHSTVKKGIAASERRATIAKAKERLRHAPDALRVVRGGEG